MPKFKCPKCGDYKYGSYSNEDDTLTRQCHGDDRCCSFEWHEKDDHFYEVATVDELEAENAEFEKALIKISKLKGWGTYLTAPRIACEVLKEAAE